MSKQPSMIYEAKAISPGERAQIMEELKKLRPIWEMRYSKSNPPPAGESNRSLLRPVYWWGNWQFACLNYYQPPKGLYNRCIRAEAFPPVIQKIVQRIESQVHNHYSEKDIPFGWELNTCLVNFYGSRWDGEKWVDVARVGEHKDFEPGPVASLSLGEKAYFQFVASGNKAAQSQVVISQWLEDSSLQIFAGDYLKKKLFHRVQRVEDKGQLMPFEIENFRTRRINFTFRYVPRDHFVDFERLPEALQEDVRGYIEKLGETSSFFKSLSALPDVTARSAGHTT